MGTRSNARKPNRSSSATAASVDPKLQPSPNLTVRSLTLTEVEIFKLLFQPLTRKEIAAKMGVSESTIKYHLNNIYAKFGISGVSGEALRLKFLHHFGRFNVTVAWEPKKL